MMVEHVTGFEKENKNVIAKYIFTVKSGGVS